MMPNQLVVSLSAFKWPITGATRASLDRLQITTWLWKDYRLQHCCRQITDDSTAVEILLKYSTAVERSQITAVL